MKFIPKKSLGQNFLIDEKVTDLIVNIGNINNKDTVVEVGPGKGALTQKILKKNPNKFIVIEKDNELVKGLEKKFEGKIKIINEDMMKISYSDFFNKNLIIFGNLPYNISTQILAKWIKMDNLENFCKKFVLMFQKEVADRVIATKDTKNYGRLSILSNWKMKIEKIIDIEPDSFKPTPRVKSTVLVFVPKKKFYKIKDPKNLEHITNVFFNQRRKMIKKPLRHLFKDYQYVSKKLSLDLNLRPQNLDRLTFYKICELYEALIN
tara:strand:- start:250 stop:1041 length:792 start_codon:yes stop_codon:yes gene_type:complete